MGLEDVCPLLRYRYGAVPETVHDFRHVLKKRLTKQEKGAKALLHPLVARIRAQRLRGFDAATHF